MNHLKISRTLFIFFYCLTFHLSAQVFKTSGISGGDIRCLCAANGKLYAGSSSGVVYRSADNGNSWVKVSMPYTSNYSNSFLKLFADSNRIFAATNYGFYYSEDEGTTWVNTSIINPVIVTGIAKSGSKLFVTTNRSGLFYSVNHGTTFIKHGDPAFAQDSDLRNIYADKTGKLFVGVYTYINNHYLESGDNGANWDAVSVPEVPTGMLVRDGRIFVSSYYTNYYSSDHWTTHHTIDLSQANPSGRTYLLTQTDSSIFLYYNYGLLRSRDTGNTWSALPFFKSVNDVLSINNIVFVASGAGIYQSNDEGLTWAKSDAGIAELKANGFAEMGNTILLSTKNAGLFSSADKGLNWNYASEQIPFESINSVCQDIKNEFIYVLVDGAYIYVSKNKGFTWQKIKTLTGTISSPAISLACLNGKFYLNNRNHDFYKADTSLVFQKISDPNTAEYLFNLDTTIYALTQTGIYSSGLDLWSKKEDFGGFSMYTDYFVSKENNILALSNSGTVLASSDYGNTWDKSTPGSPSSGCAVMHGIIYTGNKNTLLSSANGKTWSTSPTLFSDYLISLVPVFSKNNNLFFTKTADGLWYKTILQGLDELSGKEHLMVYPNPFHDELFINHSLINKTARMVLRDVLGKELIRMNPSDDSTETLNLHDLSDGIYFITVGMQTVKVIKY